MELGYGLANRFFSMAEICLITGIGIVVRRQLRDLRDVNARLQNSRNLLDQQRSLMEIAASISRFGGWSVRVPELSVHWSDFVCELHGQPHGYQPTLEQALACFAPQWRAQLTDAVQACIQSGVPFDQEAELIGAGGALLWVRASGRAVRDTHDNIVRIEGSLQDISHDKENQFILVQMKHRFHQLADAVPQIIWTAAPDGEVDYFNKALLEYSGIRDRRQLRGKAWLSLVHPDDVGACLRDWQKSVLNTRVYSRVFRLRNEEGQYRWHAVQARPVKDEAGNLIKWCGSAVDVHDTRMLAERHINNLETITDAFMTIDRNWCFTYVNQEAERVLNCRREDLLTRNVWELFSDAGAFETQYRRVAADRTPVEFEEYYAPLGKWFDVRALPSDEGLVVYFRDVTRRHLQAEEMRLARERFEILARATTDAVRDWNISTDLVWWNDSMHSLFGYSPEELEPDARSWTTHIHPEDLSRVMQGVQEILASNRNDWQDEYRFCRRDGSQAYVFDKGFIIRDQHGKALRMVGGMVDVTETRFLQERLAQAQRLEALGQLTGGVAHDFNNLLTVIMGNGELLSEQLQDQPDKCQLIDLINQASFQASQLTCHLLAFARRQPLLSQPTDIRSLINGMENMLRRSLMANMNIELVHAAGLWPALVDAAQLESALLNLCLNARDAMPDGGLLTIETGNTYLDESYAAQHQEVQSGQYVMIAVSDTGSGISAITLGQVFDPFFTTKEPGKGTGLGLSMVYGFVKQSKGHIKIYTELRHGTTVRMYLPRALDPGTQPVTQATPQLRGKHAVILLVEDDLMVSTYARHLLEELGYKVLSATNGPDALAIIEQTRDIKLLFTDVIMPGGMNGRQLADAACKLRPDLKVLFTSGYTENAIVHHGRLDPGVHLLSKPYQRKDLVGKLLQVLGEQR
jgi:PAS domain S-box-containing protein